MKKFFSIFIVLMGMSYLSQAQEPHYGYDVVLQGDIDGTSPCWDDFDLTFDYTWNGFSYGDEVYEGGNPIFFLFWQEGVNVTNWLINDQPVTMNLVGHSWVSPGSVTTICCEETCKCYDISLEFDMDNQNIIVTATQNTQMYPTGPPGSPCNPIGG